MKFPIGPGVTCDLDRLVNSRLLIQASSGAGKSWALRRILEQTHGKVQQLIIDPEGEFASLREQFDYVLAARQGGDTLADPRTAKLLAERLLELGASAILDIYELKPHERIQFVKVFLDALVEAPKALWHPVLVVLDEAHVYCPEAGEAASADAVKSLATRGRKRGFCLIPATQRLSKLHKDVAAECANKLIGRSSLDLDMKRAGDELGMDKAARLTLRDLGDGEFFAFGPAMSTVVTKVKVGDVQTTHPKAGSSLAARVPPPTAKIKAMLPKLSDLPAEAEAREKTEKELRQEIATLKREVTLAKKANPAPAPTVQTRDVLVLKDSHIATTEKLWEAVAVRIDQLQKHLIPLLQHLQNTVEIMHQAQERALGRGAVAHSPVPPPRPAAPLSPRPTPPRSTQSTGDIGKCERAILMALAQHSDGCTSGRLTLLTRYRFSGGFKNALSTLRQAGFIQGGNGEVMKITDAGYQAVGAVDPLPTGEELAQYWLSHPSFGVCERAILKALLESPGMTADQLCTYTGYAFSGGFKNSLSNLRTAGVIVGRNTETMRVSEELR